MGFIRTILFIVVVYYLVKVVIRYILPLLFGNYMNRRMNDFSDQFNRQRSTNTKKEGEVTVDFPSDHKSTKNKDRGEYVDYEEIKE